MQLILEITAHILRTAIIQIVKMPQTQLFKHIRIYQQ